MREHSLRPRERLATPLRNVNIHWTATPTAGTRPLFETRRLLTWEPGIPLASKRDWCLFGTGFYSSKYGKCNVDVHVCRTLLRQVTRAKSKSGAVVEHQRIHVVLKITSNTKWLFKSSAVPLYCSLVTSLSSIGFVFGAYVKGVTLLHLSWYCLWLGMVNGLCYILPLYIYCWHVILSRQVRIMHSYPMHPTPCTHAYTYLHTWSLPTCIHVCCTCWYQVTTCSLGL